ncbi:Fosmidomycin resistance protein [[Bacillus] enclensis]|uniref:MFS transporter n=1 Tax=[Bacillus] enclensis TaxID=1402860 RepID=UPI0005098C25|nr:MFS transporter [[Bacillus] enclensis]KSU64116.1 Fosmidomycin resistance protein [[Bacillus] enclensis]MBH9964741.1 MFS transporter [[Bacillus] enclensis]QWC24966.1 MFS transporter [Bacillus haikouensis]
MKSVHKQNATIYGILFAISSGHFINDTLQAVVPAMFPIIEKSLQLSYTQIGWIAFSLNMTSSLLQPVFGYYADKKSRPYLLPLGMFSSLIGLVGFALSGHFLWIILSVLFIGFGSAIFHPEGSRVAYMAAGQRRGLAQSIYQVGGNTGQSLAPIITAFIFVPFGQKGALWFSIAAIFGILVLLRVSKWYSERVKETESIQIRSKKVTPSKPSPLHNKIKWAMVLVVFLVFARSWYGAGLSNYYQFYLIEDYGLSIKKAQAYIFAFMFAGVLGTFLGGPLADRFGKRNIIFFSMLGAAPLTLALPYLPLEVVFPVIFCIGFIISSSFSVIVVYAQELLPKKIGMVSGLTVGFAFGMGAVGAVLFGGLADLYSIRFVMILCSFLPLLGMLTFLLPTDEMVRKLNH